MRWPNFSLPLRHVLVFPFLLQTFTVVGIVGWLSIESGQKAVNDLVYQLINKSERLVKQHLDSLLSTPHQINALSETAIATDILNLNNFDTAGKFYWRQATLEDISWAGYALPSGEMVGAGQWIDGHGVSIAELSPQTDQKLHNYSADEQGNRVDHIQVDDYAPTTDAWFVSTQAKGEPMWTDVYAAAGLDNYITISATRPVYGPDQSIEAILVVDLLLSSISDFLENLQVSPTAQIFIIDRNGLLIGSTDAKQYAVVSDDESQPRVKAIDSPNPLVNKAANYLKDTLNTDINPAPSQTLSFQFANHKHFLSVLPWEDDYGLNWRVVTVVPESDFMTQIRANTRNTILLSLAALGIATGLGIITAQWIARPVYRLSQASKKLAQAARDRSLNEQHQVASESVQIQELQALAQAFGDMAVALQQSFADLATANIELEERVKQRTSELQKTVNQLERTQLQLMQQEKMSALGKVAAGIAHEVNNPISFIGGNLRYVSEYYDDLLTLLTLYQQQYPAENPAIDKFMEDIDFDFFKRDVVRSVNSMVAGTERVKKIVESLRDFAHLDRDGIQVVDVHECLESTLTILQSSFAPATDRAEIQVIKNYGDLSSIECYPGDLNQVFFNIISNAIEAFDLWAIHQPSTLNKKRLPRLQIGTRQVEADRVMITIANNGPPIPLEIHTKLFDPFFTTKDVGQGTGMGLALSYRIVTHQHQGTLKCCSTLDGMTCFVIEIPVQLSTLIPSS